MPPTETGDAPAQQQSESSVPLDQQFRVELPTFEGPLDLLLHLIKKHELDILDLPIAFVTERYLAYLGIMRELNLDVASDYLLMAATLAHIKSKMLLPTVPTDQEDELVTEPEDPRAELIRRLLEYQKYKLAAEQLGGRPVVGRDVFPRGAPAPEASGPAPLADIGLFKLLDAFESVLKRIRGKISLEVSAERITIQERISQIAEILQLRRSSEFEHLFESLNSRYEVVVTFLALLEMTKMRMIRIYQAGVGSAIHIQYALLDADDAEPQAEATAVDAAQLDDSPVSAPSHELMVSTTTPVATANRDLLARRKRVMKPLAGRRPTLQRAPAWKAARVPVAARAATTRKPRRTR